MIAIYFDVDHVLKVQTDDGIVIILNMNNVAGLLTVPEREALIALLESKE